jgi:predicted dehydrogenase
VFEFFLAPEYGQWRVDHRVGGAGIFMDVGVHCVDLMRYLMGSEVMEVSAFMDTRDKPFPVDVNSAAMLRFRNGALGVIYVSFDNRNPVNTLEFRGSLGSAVCEGTLWRESTGSVRIEVEGKTEVFEPELGTPNPYILQIEHFKRCILQNTEPLVNGDEGLRDLRVCLAAYESAETGRTVRFQ